MGRRGRRCLGVVGLAVAAWSLAVAGGPAGASAKPTLTVGAQVLVPGTAVALSGAGWPDGDSVDATLCGDDALGGTADCVTTETATMSATHMGLIGSRIEIAVPPVPCPCVLLVTSVRGDLTEKIPVVIQGATTAPARVPVPQAPTEPRIEDLRVVASTTWESALGGRAPRTVTFEVHNPGTIPMRLVLLGRWGTGSVLPNVIDLPTLAPLAPAATRRVSVPFALEEFAMGAYDVRIEAQLVGYTKAASAEVTTSQWPVLLFVLLGLAVVLLAFVGFSARRRARGEDVDTEDPVDVVRVAAAGDAMDVPFPVGERRRRDAGAESTLAGQSATPEEPSAEGDGGNVEAGVLTADALDAMAWEDREAEDVAAH